MVYNPHEREGPLGLRRVTELVKDIPESEKPYHSPMKPREEYVGAGKLHEEAVKVLEEKDGKIQATKFDMGKIRCGLYPVRAYMATCEVFTYGATCPGKYSEGNWHQGEGFKWGRLIDALERHVNAFKAGIELDGGPNGSGLHVLAHAQCELAMLLECVLTGHGIDDREVRNHAVTVEGGREEVRRQYERYEDGDFTAKFRIPEEKR